MLLFFCLFHRSFIAKATEKETLEFCLRNSLYMDFYDKIFCARKSGSGVTDIQVKCIPYSHVAK